MNRNELTETVGHLLSVGDESPFYRWAIMGLLLQWPTGELQEGEAFEGEGLLLQAWSFARENASEAESVARRGAVIACRLQQGLQEGWVEPWSANAEREHAMLTGVSVMLAGKPEGRPLHASLARLDEILRAYLKQAKGEARARVERSVQRAVPSDL